MSLPEERDQPTADLFGRVRQRADGQGRRPRRGIAANRAALDTYLRYQCEQGLSTRQWRIADVSAPELLNT
ncbi:hypothetical protein [Streptomyces sp. NPDC003480]